jgi:PAS domain S-box-containing protein
MTAKKAKNRTSEARPEYGELLTQLETRQAELDLLKGIQDGLASGLDIDSIFEQAGERIVPLFPGKSVALYTYDPVDNMGTAKFILEDGLRHYPPPFKSGPIAQKALATGKTLKISTRAEYEEIGAITVPGTAPSLSGLYSPLLVNDAPVGALNIESTSEEHAFDESDVMLVSTIAGSLSVALENARLFDKAQQSNKELSEALEQQSATSEILRVMASSQSEIQPVLDAVAKNAARLCEADDVQIYRVDEDRLTQAAHFGPLPALEDGESLPLVPGLITGRAVLEQRTIHTHDSERISPEEFPESHKLQKRLKHRTVIVTPLVREGKAMGAIVVRRNEVQPFTDGQVALLATFADQAAIAIENVRLFNETTRLLKETEARNAELAVINSMQAALAAQLDFQEIIDLVGGRIGEIFEADVVGISLYDHESGIVEMPYILDHGERFFHEPRPVFGTFKYLLEKPEPIHIRTHAEFEYMLAKIQGENLGGPTEDNSHIIVPMLSGPQVIGVVSVGKLPEHAFDESDVRLLQTLANSMSVALQNARLFDETQRLLKETEQRAAELAIINTVQRALSAQLDIRGIYEAVGEELREIFDSQTIAIYSADIKSRISTTEYAFEKGRKFDPVSVPFSALHDYLLELNDTYVFNGNFPEVAARFEDYQVSAGELPKSLVGVPVRLSGTPDVVLTLTLQDIDGSKTFNESDVRLLETLASSMSVALENARLLKVTEQRAEELSIINGVQNALADKLDIKAIYDAIGGKLHEVFPEAQVVDILSYDAEKQLFIPKYILERGERFEIEPWTVSGFRKHVIETGHTMVISKDVEQIASEYDNVWIAGGEPAKSWIGVPLKVGKTVTGVISLQHLEKEYAFSESDVRLIETLASSMGVALENARLFDETQRLLAETEQRAAELQIINSVQEALASKLEMQAIYELVGEKIREIFKADTTFIAFHDPDNNLLLAPYYADKGVIYAKTSRPYGNGLAEALINSGAPLHMNTAEEMDAHGAYHIASPGSTEDLNQSFLGVPIFRNGVPIGAASVQSYQAYAFDRNDLSLLQTLTNSMSVALENARLFGETQRLLDETEQRAAELATINAVGQALAAEPELEALIQLIGDQICSMFSADIAYVALLDQRSNLINFPYTFGEKFDPLQLGEGLTSKIIQSGEPLLINEQMDKRREEMGVTLVGQRALSFLGVPIQIGGRTLGVISVQSTSVEGRFDDQDLRLLHTIATNVGSAIRNAQLFEEVKRQNEYYAAVIENSPAAIVLMDLETHVTGWNPAAEQLFGYTEAEALGRKVDDLVAKHRDLHDEAVRYSQQALSEKSVRLLAQRTRKDGSLVDVEVAGLPVVVDGVQVEFIAIYHDITELQRARQEAEEANRAKSTFLANMSHELRTPLNAIIGFTRIVRRKGEGLLPDKQVDNLDKVLVSADHLLNLINTILDIAKIEAGRMDVKASSFDLPGLIELITSTSQPLLQPGVVLKSEVPGQLPGLFTDQEKVKQILLNLLSNAAKFTHEGQIMLAVHQMDGFVQVDVQDTGIGISPEDLEKVFEEFQQADSSTTREYGGTGLGLAISRSLARLLGGDLTATSSAGKGSTFSLSIPVRYGEPTAAALPAAIKQQDPEPIGSSPLILAIDNDTNVHDLLKENLTERGYEVIGVMNGEEGVRLAHELHPFAITLDIMMPGKDGWQVLHELKSDPATREIPVILVTIVDKQTLGYQLGAADYLIKPLEEEALLDALTRIGQIHSQPSLRLLVVDDDPNIPELVRQLLENSSFQISAAPDGKAALAAVEGLPPDIILLDLMMPNMDGFAFIEALRERGVQIPIIVLTAKTLTDADFQVLEGSVERVIKKNGLDPERLMGELAETVKQLGGRIAAG